MNNPRECACLDGDGDPCPSCGLCNGTGKVWPSVEGESVEVREVQAGHPQPFLEFLSLRGGVYRVIVQPLPSPDGRGEKEAT